MVVDYSKGQIYMIESIAYNLRYYGSTCSPLHKRLYGHKNSYKRFKEDKCRSITSFDVLDCSDVKIILVEAFPCANKSELTAREAWYIRNNDCVNKYIPGRTNAEWRNDNKEEIKIKGKAYRDSHKEEIKIKDKTYYQKRKKKITCECGSAVRKDSIRRHERSKKHIKFLSLSE